MTTGISLDLNCVFAQGLGRRSAAALLPLLFGNNVLGHTTWAPQVGFELAANGIHFLKKAHTQAHARARARSNTHTHTHTNNIYYLVCATILLRNKFSTKVQKLSQQLLPVCHLYTCSICLRFSYCRFESNFSDQGRTFDAEVYLGGHLRF